MSSSPATSSPHTRRMYIAGCVGLALSGLVRLFFLSPGTPGHSWAHFLVGFLLGLSGVLLIAAFSSMARRRRS